MSSSGSGSSSRDFPIPEGLPFDPTAQLRPTEKEETLASWISVNNPALLKEADLLTGVMPPLRRGNYRLKRKMGRSRFGELWEAHQLPLDRIVAVKRVGGDHVPASAVRNAELLFYREALVVGQLDHPNIVPVYDMGADASGHPLLAMKLVDGARWNQAIQADAGMPRNERLVRHLGILLRVANAVAFAHSRGIVHRDLKPSLVMVGRYGEVYVMDWALAVSVAPVSEAGRLPFAPAVSQASNPAGTPVFMAPEQTVETAERIGPWTDVYLLGGILYHLLTGMYPHPGPTSKAAFRHAARGVVKPPEEAAPSAWIPEDLSRTCMAALSPAISDRPRSVQELILPIEQYLSGANLRTESRALTLSAQRLFEQCDGGYTPFQQCEAEVARALSLWRANPEARDLHDRVHARFASVAMGQGDLSLAGAQARRIADPATQEPLQVAIRVAERLAHRNAKQRRVAIVASFVLLFFATGLGLWLGVHKAQAREQRMKLESAARAKEQERLAAEGEKERQEKDARVFSRITKWREDTQRLRKEAASIPAPRVIDRAEDWSAILLNADRAMADGYRERRKALLNERNALVQGGVSLEKDSPDLLMADGSVMLAAARDASAALDAFRIFDSVATNDPSDPWAHVAAGVAAARAGEMTSATESALRAIEASKEMRTLGHNSGLMIANDVAVALAQPFTTTTQDIIIEASIGGQNYSCFKILSGVWEHYKGGAHGKSAAPYLTSQTVARCHSCMFYAPYQIKQPQLPAVVRFTPAIQGRQQYNVYVTWPVEANASPIHYVVHHASGDTTISLMQDGYAPRGELTANKWVWLGEFYFDGDKEQYVEQRVEADVRPLTTMWFGQACADAVFFSKKRIPDALHLQAALPFRPAVQPPVEEGRVLSFFRNPVEAVDTATSESKKLAVMVEYPVSSAIYHPLNQYRDYCENRLLTDPAVRTVLSRDYVILRLDGHKFPDLAMRYGSEKSGDVFCVQGLDGEIVLKLAGDELLISPLEFASKLYAL